MAQVPYSHIEAPRVLMIDGVRAYSPGDPVPLQVARELGLLDAEDAPPVLDPYGTLPAKGEFVDGEISVAPAGDTTGAPPAPAGDTPPAPAGSLATPPQAPAKPPKQGA